MEELELGLWEAMNSLRPSFRCSWTQLYNHPFTLHYMAPVAHKVCPVQALH